MDRYKDVKNHCLEAARNSWQAGYYPPYVIGFKNSESFMMLMPRFISNREMINKFMDTVSSEKEWDAMSIFNHTDEGNIVVTLVLPGRLLVATAEIIHNSDGLSLGNFSDWQDVDDESVSLSHRRSRDVGNAIQKKSAYRHL